MGKKILLPVLAVAFRDVAEEVETKELIKTAETFMKNVRRTNSMLLASAGLYQMMSLHDFNAKRAEHMNSWRMGGLDLRLVYMEGLSQWWDHHNKCVKAFMLKQHIELPDDWEEAYDNIMVAMQAVIDGMLLGCWTAYEVLMGDLWVAALNARPKLGLIALNAVPSADPSGDVGKKAKAFQVPVHELMEYDYNLNSHMGDALRNKWSFARRDHAIEAYLEAFRDSKDTLRPIIEADSIRWLFQVRNVMVHKGGVADKDFLTNVQNHHTLGKLKLDDLVMLDGEGVMNLVDPVLEKGVELIEFVDKWMVANPK